MTDPFPPFSDAIQVIIGEKLSSVTFILDYWQLDFDGHRFSVLTWLSVTRGSKTVRSGEAGFRDELCGQIAKIVRVADFASNVLSIAFEDGSAIRAFAREEDYRHPCPEALLFESHKFRTLYVVNDPSETSS